MARLKGAGHSGYDTDEGWETDYSVIERVPKPPALPPAKDDDWLGAPLSSGPMHPSRETDFRETSLCVDLASVTVHNVDWVSYRSTTHTVSRHRFEKDEPKF